MERRHLHLFLHPIFSLQLCQGKSKTLLINIFSSNRRLVERRNSAESMNSMIGRELAEIDGDGDSHVLKPSELTKGRKRKNIPAPTREENNDSVDGDDEFTQLQPKPGAHMVLPFIPPKVDSFNVFRKKNTFIAQLTRGLFFFFFQFPTMKKEGDSLIKPSEYLKSLTSRGTSLPRFNFFLFAIYRHSV